MFKNAKSDEIHTWDDIYLLLYDIAQFIQTHNNIPIEKKEFNEGRYFGSLQYTVRILNLNR